MVMKYLRHEDLEFVDCVDGRQRCAYCKRAMLNRKDGMKPEEVSLSSTKDHMRPRALGGANEEPNYLRVCARCNGLKGHVPYDAFKVFADMVLIPYPDLPLPILRNSLNLYIMHLVDRAIENRRAMRESCTIALLGLVGEVKTFERGDQHRKRKSK